MPHFLPPLHRLLNPTVVIPVPSPKTIGWRLPSHPYRFRHSSSQAMSVRSDSQHEDLFNFSSGRWLWDEDTQLRERYRRFNVHELQRIAARSMDAQTCVSIKKLAEGGFNKVFRLVMDNGATVIARIPNPNAGPPFKTTASEVATMDFVRSVRHIS